MAHKNILFIDSWSEMQGGGQTYLLRLISNLNRDVFKPLVVLPAKGEFAAKLETIGVKVFDLPFHKFHTIFGFHKTLKKIRRICIDEKVDLIHCNSSVESSTFLALLLSKLLKIPALWQVHIPIKSWPRDNILAALSDKIVCVSDYACTQKFPWLIKSSKLACVKNGIDTKTFRPDTEAGNSWRRKFNFRSDSVIIGSLGQLSPSKGQEFLLNAFSLISQKWPNLMLVFAGRDISPRKDFVARLMALSEERKLEKRVFFQGWTDETAGFINAMDIIVVPSLIDHFPLVMLEAMACAKPIVASNVGAISEAIKDGVSGRLVPPGNAKLMSEAIEELVSNKQLSDEFGRNALNDVKGQFSLENNTMKIENLYVELLNGCK